MKSICYFNGAFIDAADARISIFDRGLLFGDAVYEVVRIKNGRIFRLADHYNRLRNSLAALKINMPFTPDQFAALFEGLIQRNQIQEGSAYLEITRGAGPTRAHLFTSDLRPNIFGFAHSAQLPAWPAQYPQGVSAITVPDIRWQRCDIKTTMILPNSLAKQQAHDAGAFEAILIAPDSTVRETAAANLFAVISGVLRTHPSDNHILPGITRKAILALARENAIPISETHFTHAEMMAAEEVFLCGTTTDVCPVVQIDGKPVASGRPGPVTQRLMELLAAALEAETTTLRKLV